MRLLYYSPASYGGLADYAHEQANALADLGIEVILLCTPSYPTQKETHYKPWPVLKDIPTPSIRALKAGFYSAITLYNMVQLSRIIRDHGFQHVLLGSYIEYLAPLWANSLKQLAQQGVVFGAVVHDPVRDFVVGPHWWHRWSIACGYSFLRKAFVHEAIALDTARPMPQLHTTVIPHGPYQFPEPTQSRNEMRLHLNLPAEAKVMLAFGHLRENKNLDLVIQAMADVPEVYLIVAGQETSTSHPLAARYQKLAAELGVGDRIRWQIRFIPDTEVANFFIAADLILLTYRSTFHSASGVLNTAVQFHKPCLASGGQGPLYSVLKQYDLGVWVDPDQPEAIAHGITQWLRKDQTSHEQQSRKYIEENSWPQNAKLVFQSMGL